MAGHGMTCMECGRTFDNGRYLELDHRIPRSEAANRPVRSRGPLQLEMTDELAGRRLPSGLGVYTRDIRVLDLPGKKYLGGHGRRDAQSFHSAVPMRQGMCSRAMVPAIGGKPGDTGGTRHCGRHIRRASGDGRR